MFVAAAPSEVVSPPGLPVTAASVVSGLAIVGMSALVVHGDVVLALGGILLVGGIVLVDSAFVVVTLANILPVVLVAGGALADIATADELVLIGGIVVIVVFVSVLLQCRVTPPLQF